MIRKLLIAYDGSDSARAAFEFGHTMARQYGAELHVVAVVRPPEHGSESETAAVVERGQAHFARALDELRAQLSAEPAPAIFEVLVGDPAEQIVRYAEMQHIDHIVVGHRSRARFERWLIGSVARQILVYAPCAVTVVRAPQA